MAAAAFRIPYSSPSTSHLSHTHLPLPSPLPNHRLPLSLATRPRNSNHHLFLVKNNPPLRALPTIQSESAQESSPELEEEVSKTRLLVQNVPWTATEEDLRPLFQKYGTVVEIEVGPQYFFAIIQNQFNSSFNLWFSYLYIFCFLC